MTTTSSDNYTVNGVTDQGHSLGLEDVVANGLEVDDSPPMKSILYDDGKKVTEFPRPLCETKWRCDYRQS